MPDIIIFCSGLNVNSVIYPTNRVYRMLPAYSIRCLTTSYSHLSAATFVGPDSFISFQKHFACEMLGEKNLAAPHAHCGEGENLFQAIRDLSCPLEMLLSSH